MWMWLWAQIKRFFSRLLIREDSVRRVTEHRERTRRQIVYLNRYNSVMRGSYCKGIKPFYINHKPLT